MMLTTVIDAYVAKQRSLGMRFEAGDVQLRRFCRAIGNRDIGEVTTQAVEEFLQGSGPPSATWMLRYRTLSGLYRFAIIRGYATFSPLPTVLPKLARQQTPYVYSKEELRRLLGATSILKVGNSPDVPPMCRTLLLLLYGSGMRIGEALRLTSQDVDVDEQVITINDTKFFKTRIVPIGPKLTQELVGHIERLRRLHPRHDDKSPFFSTRGSRPWHYDRVLSRFQHVRRAAGISCPVGELRPPRLHDIRHTAAVHRAVPCLELANARLRFLTPHCEGRPLPSAYRDGVAPGPLPHLGLGVIERRRHRPQKVVHFKRLL
jgi:integrase/recombinase XerD